MGAPDHDSPSRTSIRRGFIAASVAVVGLTVLTSMHRPLSSLESALLQSVSLALSVWASFAAGQISGHDQRAREMRAPVKSAFRRTVRIYQGIGRQGQSIEGRRQRLHYLAEASSGSVPISEIDAALDLLTTQVQEQLGTVDDAMEDWRDLAPDQVGRVEQKGPGALDD